MFYINNVFIYIYIKKNIVTFNSFNGWYNSIAIITMARSNPLISRSNKEQELTRTSDISRDKSVEKDTKEDTQKCNCLYC